MCPHNIKCYSKLLFKKHFKLKSLAVYEVNDDKEYKIIHEYKIKKEKIVSEKLGHLIESGFIECL